MVVRGVDVYIEGWIPSLTERVFPTEGRGNTHSGGKRRHVTGKKNPGNLKTVVRRSTTENTIIYIKKK